MKNTFSKLRRVNKVLRERLDNEIIRADKTLILLKEEREEINRLNKAIAIKDITINSLEVKEKELSDKIYSMYDKLDERIKLSNYYYNEWIDEHETNGKLSIGLTIMSFVIVGLVVTLIGVIK